MTYDDLVDMAIPELPGVFRPAVLDAAKRVAREFCSETFVWQQEEEIEIYAGSVEADIYAPSGSEVVSITSIPGMTRGIHYTQPSPSVMRLSSAPEQSGIIKAMLALRPGLRSDQLPTVLDAHEDALVAGLIYRMAKMSGVEWANPQVAQTNYIQWQAFIAEARQRSQNGLAFGSRTVKPRRFI